MGQLADHRFTALLEAAPDAMICVGQDGRIALVNAQAERLFGYTRDELVGQPVDEPAARPAEPSSAHRSAETGGNHGNRRRRSQRTGV
jgi:PAS domain S-box-containing protein